jgi:protocatechuate 3,4-dioxygenase beta subunit
MSSKNALLVVVSLLCLGGLGWLVYDQTGAREGVVDLERAAPTAADGAADRAAELSAGTATSDPAAAPTALRAQQAAPELDSKAKALVASEHAGTKVVGHVVDDAGRPLAGAEVRVGNAISAEFFTRLRDGGVSPRHVTTDSAGRFEWIGARPGSNTVTVRADGFAPLDKDAEIPIEAVHDLGELRVALGAVLSGRVVDDTGRAVAGARLHLVESDFDFAFTAGELARAPLATCEADGSFRVKSFACGPWKIRVHSDDHPDRLFEGNAERPGFEVSGLRFELAAGTTIEGVALGVPADQVGKVKVRAQSIDDPRGGFGFGIGGRSREAEVGADGRFRIRGLGLDQRWQLQLRSAVGSGSAGFDFFRQRARSASMRANSGDRGVQLRWQRDSGVTLQVVDAKTRAPLEEFEVSAGQGWRMEPLRAADGKAQKSFPKGNVRVGDLYPSADGGGAKIEIRAPGYADWSRQDIALLAEADVNLGVIELAPTPTLVVTVLDAATQAPVADARVSLRPARKLGADGEVHMSISMGASSDGEFEVDDGNQTRRARTDEKGIATLSSFPGQACSLRVEAEGRAPFALEGLKLPDDARHEQTVRLSAGGSVAVHVTDKGGRPISGLRIEHRRNSQRGPPMPFGGPNRAGLVTNSEGRAFATNLEPGKHRFRVAESGGGALRMGGAALVIADGGEPEDEGWSEVEVVEGQETKLELETVARAALTGIVREAGLALAGATLNLEEDTGESAFGDMRAFGRGMRFGGIGGGGDARTSGQGEYLIEGRKPGKYKLVVEHALRAMPESFPIELREGENRLDIELLLTTIEGRVVDAQGKPIAGVRVRAEEHRPDSGRARMMFAFAMDDGEGETVTIGDGSEAPPSTTDADGHYLLRGVAADVPLVVRAETKDWQPARSEPVEVAPGGNKQGVDLVLERGGKLEIEALDAADKPVRMAFVTATPTGGGEPKTGVVGPGGVCTLSGLKPGSYTVNARRMGPPGGGKAQNPDAQTAVVAAGEASKLTFRFE